MATKTALVASFMNGAIRFEIDYDDATGRVSVFRCINTTDDVVFGDIVDPSQGFHFSQNFAQRQSFEIAIPGNRVRLTLDGTGEIIGGFAGQFRSKA